MLQQISVTQEDRMDVDNDARLTPKGREAMVRAAVKQAMTKSPAAGRRHTRTTALT